MSRTIHFNNGFHITSSRPTAATAAYAGFCLYSLLHRRGISLDGLDCLTGSSTRKPSLFSSQRDFSINKEKLKRKSRLIPTNGLLLPRRVLSLASRTPDSDLRLLPRHWLQQRLVTTTTTTNSSSRMPRGHIRASKDCNGCPRSLLSLKSLFAPLFFFY